jgi:hypothetical protein
MKRRDFVNAGTAALATSAFNPAAGGAHAGARPNNQARIAVKIAIENGSYRVEVDSESIYGREEQISSHEKTANRLTLTWNGPLKNPRGSFDVDVVRCAQTVSACV